MANRQVYVVDDDSLVRRSTVFFLSSAGFDARPFASGIDFLESAGNLSAGCVLLDVRMPEIDGIQVLEKLNLAKIRRFSVIVMTGHGDINTAVRAMKLGASDFVQKPFPENDLLEMLDRAFARQEQNSAALAEHEQADALLAKLSPRERGVLQGLVSGLPNKMVAHQLNLSVRTVEMHRGRVMERLGAKSLGEAMRIAFLGGIETKDQAA